MITYISPKLSFKYLLRSLFYYKDRARRVIDYCYDTGAKSVYLRKKQRYALTSFLKDIGWKNKNVLIPAYTCRSIRDAVEASGNCVSFYDINSHFNPDIASIEAVARKSRIDAIIISDVYGVKMDISYFLKMIDYKPLIIADFAHYDNIDVKNIKRKYIDIVMYSSAYYKPVPSSGLGLLLVISDRIKSKSSVLVSYSWLKAVVASVKLIAIKIILSTIFMKYFLKFRKGSTQLENEFYITKISEPVAAISLSQIENKFVPHKSNNHKKALFLNYQQSIKALNSFLPYSDCLTYFTILVPEDKRDYFHLRALDCGLLLGRIFGNIAGEGEDNCPVSNMISRRVLNLPYLICLNDKKKKRIIKIINEVIEDVQV